MHPVKTLAAPGPCTARAVRRPTSASGRSSAEPRPSLPLPVPLGAKAVRRASRVCRLQAPATGANGNGKNGTTEETVDPMHETVEMFVAHGPVDTNGINGDSSQNLLDRAKTMAKRIVPQPFSGTTALSTVDEPPSASTALSSTPDATALAAVSSRQSRALQAELGMTASELREKTKELQETRGLLRRRDAEVSALKQTLQKKDESLKAARSDLLQARVEIQEKDGQLQTALEQLTVAAKERAKLRSDLISAQSELRDKLGELSRWTEHLNELKNVMESVDLEGLEDGEGSDWDSESDWGGLQALGLEMQIPGGDSASVDDSDYIDMLTDLNSLASSLALEAMEDEATYGQLNERLDGNPYA